jgi:hypothetical protein
MVIIEADGNRSELGSPCLVDTIRSGFSYCDIQYPSICALVLDWWAVTRQSRAHELRPGGMARDEDGGGFVALFLVCGHAITFETF